MNLAVSPSLDQPSLPPHAVALPTVTARQRVLAVGLVGPGRVGSALLDQLRAARPRLARGGLDLRLCGVAASRRMWLDADDPELNGRFGGAQTWRPSNLDEFVAHVRGDGSRHAMLIDCSASEAVASRYAEWLAAGLHVVTPNKQAGSGPLPACLLGVTTCRPAASQSA